MTASSGRPASQTGPGGPRSAWRTLATMGLHRTWEWILLEADARNTLGLTEFGINVSGSVRLSVT
eukprot:3705011-Pyramimonas_sp.AAC.1